MARRGAVRTTPPDAAALRALPWAELEAAAAPLLDPPTRAYSARGARDGRALARNVAAWDAWWIRPRRLTGIATPSLATTLLGTPVAQALHHLAVRPSARHREPQCGLPEALHRGGVLDGGHAGLVHLLAGAEPEVGHQVHGQAQPRGAVALDADGGPVG